MKAQSKTIGMAIGVVLIIAIFTGVVLSSRGQAISSEISGNSEGGAALSLANTEDTEIVIKKLFFCVFRLLCFGPRQLP